MKSFPGCDGAQSRSSFIQETRLYQARELLGKGSADQLRFGGSGPFNVFSEIVGSVRSRQMRLLNRWQISPSKRTDESALLILKTRRDRRLGFIDRGGKYAPIRRMWRLKRTPFIICRSIAGGMCAAVELHRGRAGEKLIPNNTMETDVDILDNTLHVVRHPGGPQAVGG